MTTGADIRYAAIHDIADCLPHRICFVFGGEPGSRRRWGPAHCKSRLALLPTSALLCHRGLHGYDYSAMPCGMADFDNAAIGGITSPTPSQHNSSTHPLPSPSVTAPYQRHYRGYSGGAADPGLRHTIDMSRWAAGGRTLRRWRRGQGATSVRLDARLAPPA